MSDLPHILERTVHIKAPRDTVFRYFTDSSRWAAWWGTGSTIDAHPGGKVWIRFPNGVEVSGEVVEVSAPERIIFTYGFESGKPIPPGASRVVLRLEAVPTGTQLHLTHRFAEAEPRDHHVQGWRYQLAVFANVVMNDQYARVADTVRTWWAAWSNPDADARRAALAPIVASRVHFADRFGLVEGLEDLLAHIAAIHTFMPDTKMAGTGDVLHCQGTVLGEWSATGSDGRPKGTGTNVFVFDGDGHIANVTGFWRDKPSAG